MTKRTQSTEFDIEENKKKMADAVKAVEDFVAVVAAIPPETLARIRLIDSNIITATEGEISWREGHLEHLAHLYASDPAQTWRDYADDLPVALAHDARFAGMVEKAKGK